MSYLTLAQMAAEMPADFIAQALDDEGEGDAAVIADTFDTVQEAVSDKIHSYLSQRFETPFVDPVPPMVKQAARVFTGDMLYRRRGFKGDDNPFSEEEEKFCKLLSEIGAGERPLLAGKKQKTESVSTVTEAARTTSSQNYLSS